MPPPPTVSVSVAPTVETRAPKPWYNYITLDLLLGVLSRSVFHPAIVFVFYLCLASIHKHRTASAYYTLYYGCFLAVVEIALYVNRRIAYGWPRTVKWEDEVVVITGGGSGLGRMVAEMLMVGKGARVAVLDIKQPDVEAREWMEGRGGFVWEVCDITDLEAVKRASATIEDELGKPTILINNAAMPVNGLPLLPKGPNIRTLSPIQAAKTIGINTTSHFNTLSVFLPSLMTSKNGGHIVTISSSLAWMTAANLSDYNASKGALSALHHTLEAEIAQHPSKLVRRNLKTILVEPGQLDTALFADIVSVPWYANFSGPVIEAKDLAKEIVRQLDYGESTVIRIPAYTTCMPFFAFMPGSLQKLLRWFSGVDQAITDRRKED